MNNPERVTLNATIPDESAGQRLDQVLAELFDSYSRARLQKWVKEGCVTLNGSLCSKPREKVHGGESVVIEAELESETAVVAQDIPLDVIFEDEHLLIVNKPAGMVVHPAAGNPDGTLQNALLHYDPALAAIPRSGLVHRIDKDTSGLLMVARTLTAHNHLVERLQQHDIEREYQAITMGVMVSGGTVETPIGRHPVDRLKMAVTERGKEAITHYRVEERFRAHTHIKVQLETGRTHQIRVHMAHLRFPLVGDPVYGGRIRIPAESSEQMIETLRGFRRQALHAARLGLEHPETGELLSWEAPLPADMAQLIQVLCEDAEQHREQSR
ncbi:hypothetical protein BOW53_07365 [Solemya pervernicosa gill symbiont]|uniref:Pseudouridine synthase n=2 Tax=Gammaproteobacteria incertae sedis TaxID=118884 RepID=A0A1T2L643_9GAMM|nr:23S rRNA pseudouridine(1911/1915/1917) synthase RluD [Candidatus Reidiella endopervernicosa]OOZ40524.1 hypothetical protein BOW53_07365 [Solemya pervernicosa gill symbiont]QKQ27510.1 23S rRNA pseudouridine(1911/1915/1917) synthase RluD [Candidatus Reidiella endopervernicosa]